jgi:plasmid maintenance system antidote protein VapI
MVRNEQLSPLGDYARAVAKAVAQALEDANISGAALGRHLDRAQSYASLRIQGRRPWTTDEVDRIAELLGIPVDDLWSAARKYRRK